MKKINDCSGCFSLFYPYSTSFYSLSYSVLFFSNHISKSTLFLFLVSFSIQFFFYVMSFLFLIYVQTFSVLLHFFSKIRFTITVMELSDF